MKLFGWPADQGGCAWYRIIGPLESLRDSSDVTIDISQIMSNEVLDNEEWLIILQRSTNPSAMMALEYFFDKGRKWVYDIDDLLWALEPSNPAFGYYNQPIVRQRLKWHMRNAPICTSSTANLADEMREMGAKNVHVLPNTLPQRVVDNLNQIVTETPADDRFTIFWRGSPTHKDDIKIIKYALKRWNNSDEVRIVLAGTDYRKELGVPDAEFMPWTNSPEEYLYSVARVRPDIALCPLQPNRFNYSKSHVNALEATAIGAVPLCSNISAYQELITDTENGFLLSTNEHHWDRLVRDLVAGGREGLSSMRKAAVSSTTKFITENWKDEYLNVYRTAF